MIFGLTDPKKTKQNKTKQNKKTNKNTHTNTQKQTRNKTKKKLKKPILLCYYLTFDETLLKVFVCLLQLYSKMFSSVIMF